MLPSDEPGRQRPETGRGGTRTRCSEKRRQKTSIGRTGGARGTTLLECRPKKSACGGRVEDAEEEGSEGRGQGPEEERDGRASL